MYLQSLHYPWQISKEIIRPSFCSSLFIKRAKMVNSIKTTLFKSIKSCLSVFFKFMSYLFPFAEDKALLIKGKNLSTWIISLLLNLLKRVYHNVCLYSNFFKTKCLQSINCKAKIEWFNCLLQNGCHEIDAWDLDEKLIVEKMSHFRFLVYLDRMKMRTLTAKDTSSNLSLLKKTFPQIFPLRY